jgi:hypothetical protein
VHTAVTGTACLLKKAASPRKLPTSQQLLDKYGHHSWAVISDCRGAEEYAQFLAERGFNLVLMGDEQDIQIAKEMAEKRNNQVEFDCVPVDWRKQETNL